MKLTKHSKNKLLRSFEQYSVPQEYADPLINYLVYGFNPGSFWTAVLANDFLDAMAKSHPANNINALKNVGCWIINEMPCKAYGSREKVKEWTELSEDVRRSYLVEKNLIHTEQDEIVLILKDVPTHEPHLW
jgi:hypothetical protein